MPDWIVYYHDSTALDSDAYKPETLPRDGVQIVIVRDKVYGRLIWHRYEGWCWQNGIWVPHNDRNGVEQYQRLYPNGVTLNGFYIPDEDFWRVYQKAFADANERMPANVNLPSQDMPLPMRFRAWAFSDEGDWSK